LKKVKIFADGADLADMVAARDSGLVQGFTTNPTLMREAGITDYEGFAKSVLAEIGDCPVCFEVIADDFAEMARQAVKIAAWADNVYVKIPVTNTKGESAQELISRLGGEGIKINVTAVLGLDQVRAISAALAPDVPAIVSVFAGRIADTGLDPVPLMSEALGILESRPRAELLWASPREVLNIYQAEACGCHIITVTRALLDKTALFGMDLEDLSLETVRMFFDDASRAGYLL
jgi:transaldolase